VAAHIPASSMAASRPERSRAPHVPTSVHLGPRATPAASAAQPPLQSSAPPSAHSLPSAAGISPAGPAIPERVTMPGHTGDIAAAPAMPAAQAVLRAPVPPAAPPAGQAPAPRKPRQRVA
jgi:hypothetical protein